MTLTPDRLDDLDFYIPEIEQAERPLPTGAEIMEAVYDAFERITTDDNPWQVMGHVGTFNQESWCSPSRSMLLGIQDSGMGIVYRAWTPPLPRVMSKELVVVNPT